MLPVLMYVIPLEPRTTIRPQCNDCSHFTDEGPLVPRGIGMIEKEGVGRVKSMLGGKSNQKPKSWWRTGKSSSKVLDLIA